MSDSSHAASGRAASPHGGTASARPSDPSSTRRFDFLVLGSGLAGLHYALRVADVGDVAIITKRRRYSFQ